MPVTVASLLRKAVVWITMATFLATQTAAGADPHAEGTAAGQAANPVARGAVDTSSAASVVPGYTTTPPQSSYFGQPNLSGPANALLAACALTPNDPACQAVLGARTSANTPREAVSPYDPSVLAARRIAGNPATTLEDIASYYSGCQVDTVATPATETRVCRQYSGTSGQSCARTLSVSVTRTSSCSPGDWFAQAASGKTAMAVQCKPDLPPSAQHFRVTSDGAPLAFFDVDMTSALVFPQMVAQLPQSGGWWGRGKNGFWVANNRCVADSCSVTGFIAQEYRQICSGTGGDAGGDYACKNEPPFLEEYASCPAGTQSGDNISYTVGGGGDSGNSETLYLDQATCYAPTSRFSEHYGHDITGTVRGRYWKAQSSRPIVGFRLNPAYGSIPQMTLAYERPHTNVTEADQWDEQCPSLDGDSRCAVTGAARCVDGPRTKEIDGAQVSRACWRYETALSCQYGAATDECAPLHAAGCTPASTNCQRVNPATGACEITENRYTCPVVPSSTVTATNCPANVFCMAGSCFSTAYTNDADFARSMSFLEAAREAGVYLDTDNLQVFKGEANSCRDRLLKNCCASDSAGKGMTNQSMFGVGSRLVFDVLMNSGNRQFLYQGMQALLLGGGFSGSFTSYGVTVAINGTALPAGSAVLYSGQSIVVAFDPWSLAIAVVIYGVMSMMSCNAEEGKLAMKEGARLCRTIGTYCSSCIRVFGRCVSCIEHTTGKCCFNSVLARIINEQGRQQVGKRWGSAKSPDCSGFTIEQLQALDFARMDLTEFYASIVPNLPNVGTIQSGNAARMSDCYYGEGRCQ